jgi:hypothetical protein
MDTPKALPKSAHLLDDLESIRQLLGDEHLQPPLLTDTVLETADAIPVLLEVERPEPASATTPPRMDQATAERNRQDTLLHLDSDLRAAAQQILQDVISDFAPHIETEIKRRLEARLERLLPT